MPNVRDDGPGELGRTRSVEGSGLRGWRALGVAKLVSRWDRSGVSVALGSSGKVALVSRLGMGLVMVVPRYWWLLVGHCSDGRGSRACPRTQQAIHHFGIVEIVILEVEGSIVLRGASLGDRRSLGLGEGSGLGELNGIVLELLEDVCIQSVELVVGVLIHCLRWVRMPDSEAIEGGVVWLLAGDAAWEDFETPVEITGELSKQGLSLIGMHGPFGGSRRVAVQAAVMTKQAMRAT